MILQDRANSSVNGTGSSRQIDTPLTQLRSLDVPTLRRIAQTHPKAPLIWTLIEQIKNYRNGTGNPQTLPAMMARTLELIDHQ